jgi:anaerobic selenocysteine-containing dehydrogenase
MMAITGNIDIPGGGIFIADGLEGLVTEAQFIYDAKYRLPPEVEAETWGHQEFPLLRDACLLQGHSTTMWQAMRKEKLKALFVVRSEPLMTHADTRECVEDIKKLELLVVPNFYMSPTAEFADYVLPAATWCERDDIRTGYLSTDVVQKAIEPLGECWDDNKIAVELVKKLKRRQYPHVLDFPWESVDEFNQYRIKDLGISFDEFKRIGVIPYQKEYRRYEKRGFETPSGKIELVPTRFEKYGYSPLPKYQEPEESPISTPELAKDYPLILITGSRSVYYFSSSHRDVEKCRQAEPQPVVRFHSDTAQEYGIEDGEWCWIRTARGRVKMVAEVTDRVKPGVVVARHGWWFPEDKSTTQHALNDSNINLITFKGVMDNIIGTQHMKSLLCTLDKA